MNRESRQEDPNTLIDTPNIEKQEQCNRNELQSNNNRNNAHPNDREQTLTEKEETMMNNLKRIMSEKKTRLPSLRNNDWNTVKAETEKLPESSTHIPTKNIPYLEELIYAEVRLVCKKVGVPLKNTNRN